MTYKEELIEKYRKARERMQMGVKSPVVPRHLVSAASPPGGILMGTGILPPLAKVQEAPPEPVEREETARERTTRELQKVRVSEENKGMPRLAPLPGYDYGDTFAECRRTIAAVADKFSLKSSDLTGPSRVKLVVRARFECMYRMRVDLKMSYPAIADKMGRDHSTVIHGVNTILARALDAMKAREQSHAVPARGMSPMADTHTRGELAAA